MKLKIIIILLLLLGNSLWADSIEVPLINGERHIVVIIASYNNSNYVMQNLKSVFIQNYSNYHIIYIDDCSTDATLAFAKKYTQMLKKEDKVYFIENKERHWALYNQYHATHLCRDTDLVVILDGDDWLKGPDVFKYLNQVYSNSAIWLTYGQFGQYPTGDVGWNVPMPDYVVKTNGFREFTHAPSHLRTYYAGLFKQIKKEDLLYEGDFFKMTGDIAAMFPMMEMAREGHFKFIDKVLMIYNIGNPINDHKIIEGLQRKLDLEIRSRPRYESITTPFLTTEGELW